MQQITAQIYLDVRSWPVTANNPCYSMIHCDTNYSYSVTFGMNEI